METPSLLRTLVRYHSQANLDLETLLAPRISRWEEPCGSYFGTVKALLNHLVFTDVRWLGRIAGHGWGTEAWKQAVAGLPAPVPGAELFGDWEGYTALRRRLDGLWTDLAAGFDGTRFDEPFTYTTVQGAKVTVPWAGIFFHLLNHQTHHRGALSQVLDSWGVDNDFSGLVKTFAL